MLNPHQKSFPKGGPKTREMIEEFAKVIPETLLSKSGSVFYSGRNAFKGEKKLYILGLNPGGSDKNVVQTIGIHTDYVLNVKNDDWSEYKDESWGERRPAGTHGLQPRILHLFHNLGISPYEVPSSNLCFVRSRNEHLISKELKNYAEQCWKFHEKVINELGIRVILCFGKTVGNYVRNKLSGNEFLESVTEKNRRKWKSSAYRNERGQIVIIATHPSRADWTNPDSDPSVFIRRMVSPQRFAEQ